jgi:hypothetical protein
MVKIIANIFYKIDGKNVVGENHFFTSQPIKALISNSSRTTTLLVKQDMTLPENGGTDRLRKRQR